jgi:hypothetical protein
VGVRCRRHRGILGPTFYEKALLLPLYFVGIVWFVRAPSLRPRALLAAARADAPIVIAMVLAGAAYVVVWKARGYSAIPAESATLTEWKDFVRATWTRGTTPLLIGQNVPLTMTSFNEDVVVVGQAVLVVLVAWSTARRVSAWRVGLLWRGLGRPHGVARIRAACSVRRTCIS